MNIANVTSRFALLAGIDANEAYRWRSLVDDAISYVTSIVTKSSLDEGDKKRIEALCAVYANRLYRLCNDDSISSFAVGDVRATSSAGAAESAEKLWREYADKAQDLIGNEKFLFGRVI